MEIENYDFPSGVKDFVIRPYRIGEVIGRINKILERSTNEEAETIQCGDLVIDPARYEVTVGGNPVDLTYKEYQLLKFLATNRERVFTRDALLNRVWGYDYYGGARTVDVHVRRLRSKIEDKDHSFIETVRNVGYRFKEK
ncbi:MAG: response regulator transcription factor [Chloroflexi bacterium]|nr:response regulator transcription factor [Chloroflexota bacterium]